MIYPFRCICGGQGFVDMGKDKDNRYPCRECYSIENKKNAKLHKLKGKRNGKIS